MLLAEAVIAEVAVTLIVAYSLVKRNRSAEGVGVAIVLAAALLFVVIPITYHYMG